MFTRQNRTDTQEHEMYTDYQTEIAYRNDRVRNGVAKRTRRHTRIPFVRRPAEETNLAR